MDNPYANAGSGYRHTYTSKLIKRPLLGPAAPQPLVPWPISSCFLRCGDAQLVGVGRDYNSNIFGAMRATTTKQLMDQSKLFRVLFWGTIVCIVLGVVCFIIFPFTRCRYHSCSWWYYNTWECYTGGDFYCCPYSTSYCGSYYCYLEPMSVCLGWMIAGSTLLCTAGITAIFVFVMFCNYRAKIRSGTGYLNLPAPQYPYPQPIVVYSDQQHYQQYQQYAQPQQQPQQQYSANPINLSENQNQ